MNVLFISISSLPHMSEHSISLDLLREFRKNGHSVYVVCANERKNNTPTFISEESGCTVLRVKTGNNKQANPIEKGLTTILLPTLYISAIKKYYSGVKFDLILYPTPPITHYKTVKYIKKHHGAQSYLLLKDIFPQNAIDIGMMRKSGLKGILYRHFRRVEKKLYSISDRIGCMSQANIDYVLKHNPEVNPEKMGLCPNGIEIQDMTISEEERLAIRQKYGIPQNKKVFVYGGNLGKPQGIPFIIDCLKSQANNEDAFFLIVGGGTEFGVLERFFDEAKPNNMKLLRRLPKNDYDRMVAACDVGMIFLDHRFTIPNFPSRLLAYMQAKVPVLACTDPNTDIGKVITEGGFGWWCESNNVQAFEENVMTILKSDLTAAKSLEYDFLTNHYSSSICYRSIIEQLKNK